MTMRFRFGAASGGERFPIIAVDLVDELTQLTIPNLTAWVDTGADGTLVPYQTLHDAGFRPNRQRRNFHTIRPEQAPEVVVGYSVLVRYWYICVERCGCVCQPDHKQIDPRS